MAVQSEDLREFYDSAEAAEAASRWPLLARVWSAMGGERLAPTQASGTKLQVSPPHLPKQADRHEADFEQPDPTDDAPDPAPPSLEDLFGRLR